MTTVVRTRYTALELVAIGAAAASAPLSDEQRAVLAQVGVLIDGARSDYRHRTRRRRRRPHHVYARVSPRLLERWRSSCILYCETPRA